MLVSNTKHKNSPRTVHISSARLSCRDAIFDDDIGYGSSSDGLSSDRFNERLLMMMAP